MGGGKWMDSFFLLRMIIVTGRKTNELCVIKECVSYDRLLELDSSRRCSFLCCVRWMDPTVSRPSPSSPSRVVLSILEGHAVLGAESKRFSCPLLFRWSDPASQRVSAFHPINLCNSLFIAFRCNYSIIRLSWAHSFTVKAAFHRAHIGQILSILVCALTRLPR